MFFPISLVFQCWFKGQIISRIHLSLPNAYKLMCFDRNINGNRDIKFFEWYYWSLHSRKNLILYPFIQMSHWRHTMVDGTKFWINCKRLKLLRKAGHLQLIQNSAPYTIVRCQCDIGMLQERYAIARNETKLRLSGTIHLLFPQPLNYLWLDSTYVSLLEPLCCMKSEKKSLSRDWLGE